MGWGNPTPMAERKRDAARLKSQINSVGKTARTDAVNEFLAKASAALAHGASTWQMPFVAEAIDKLTAVRDEMIQR